MNANSMLGFDRRDDRILRAPAGHRSYDPPTAVTFLIAGIGLGVILTLLLPPFRGRGSTE